MLLEKVGGDGLEIERQAVVLFRREVLSVLKLLPGRLQMFRPTEKFEQPVAQALTDRAQLSGQSVADSDQVFGQKG